MLSHTVFETQKPTVLISGNRIPQEYLNLVRFFGPSYYANADLALAGDPTNPKGCDNLTPIVGEAVQFCVGFQRSTVLKERQVTERLLVLRRPDASFTAGTKLLLKTPHFALDEVMP